MCIVGLNDSAKSLYIMILVCFNYHESVKYHCSLMATLFNKLAVLKLYILIMKFALQINHYEYHYKILSSSHNFTVYIVQPHCYYI